MTSSDSIFRRVMQGEVYPAIGCTEPISCAYAAAVAAKSLAGPVDRVHLRVDRATFKNGAAVAVPSSGNRKGNVIAAAMGAALANPAEKLQLLRDVTPAILAQAVTLSVYCDYGVIEKATEFTVCVTVFAAEHSASCTLTGGHTRIERVEADNEVVFQAAADDSPDANGDYRHELRALPFMELFQIADRLGDDDLATCRLGVDMNLAMAERGYDVRRTAWQLRRMVETGLLVDDLFTHTKATIASAVDARMAGLPEPVMTSGGSGNQGIVAILTPWLVGTNRGIDPTRILRSIAAAHLVNAYIKCFVGELSVICGCAICAGIAAAVAIVYQHCGCDSEKINLAVGNVAGDLGGLICDGAKPGCAMKTVTSVEAAMRAAFMAMEGYGLSRDDGLVGDCPEQTVRNLGRVTLEGMFQVDPTVLRILQDKRRLENDLCPET